MKLRLLLLIFYSLSVFAADIKLENREQPRVHSVTDNTSDLSAFVTENFKKYLE